MGVTKCWMISPFFLSTSVSMAGVLYTMVSCTVRVTVLHLCVCLSVRPSTTILALLAMNGHN